MKFTEHSSITEQTEAIKVLVVEDSPTVRYFLVHLLNAAPGIRVVGTAQNGEDALEAVKSMRPNVVTMDIHMPKKNGLEAAREIMENHPVPIVIITGSTSASEMAYTLNALDTGALAVLKTPPFIDHPQHEESVRELIRTIRLMSEVKVVRRWNTSGKSPSPPVPTTLPKRIEPQGKIRLVAIGSSTGGPQVLKQILSALPKNFPIPIIVVQHIATGFTEAFAEWLELATGFSAKLARHGELMRPGYAYIAPDGYQTSVSGNGTVNLQQCASNDGHCPSVANLLRSVSESYGAQAAGLLLSGMGKDGASELGLMKNKGAITIAQDKASSVVHGMPGEAIALGAATYVLSPDKIAEALVALANQ